MTIRLSCRRFLSIAAANSAGALGATLGAARESSHAAKFLDVRSGPIATEMGYPRDVRFSTVSDKTADVAGGPFRAANNGRQLSGYA